MFRSDPEGTELEYFQSGGVDLELRMYPVKRAPRGILLFIHGGGWSVRGSKFYLYDSWEPYIQKGAYRVFSIEHRLAPDFRGENQIQDVLAAISYIREHEERFHVPGLPVTLIGFSSGGHLALMAGSRAFAERRTEKLSVVSISAPLEPVSLVYSGNHDLTKKQARGYLPLEAKRWNDFSPLIQLSRQGPPTMILHGEKDEQVPVEQAIAYRYLAKQNHRTNICVRTVPEAGHHFIFRKTPHTKEVIESIFQFIEESQ